ncbi:hypothetical protein HDV64DRAFT_140061 [Trichoderma sp. TUCIM 5745]
MDKFLTLYPTFVDFLFFGFTVPGVDGNAIWNRKMINFYFLFILYTHISLKFVPGQKGTGIKKTFFCCTYRQNLFYRHVLSYWRQRGMTYPFRWLINILILCIFFFSFRDCA